MHGFKVVSNGIRIEERRDPPVKVDYHYPGMFSVRMALDAPNDGYVEMQFGFQDMWDWLGELLKRTRVPEDTNVT